MSRDSDRETAGPPPQGGLSTGAAGPVALLLLGVLAFSAWGGRRPGRHPADAAARALGSKEVGRRIEAVADLERIGPEDPEVAIHALVGGIKDPDAEVRVASATALVGLAPILAGNGPAGVEFGRAVAVMLDSPVNDRPEVRASCTRALWMIVHLWGQNAPAVNLPAVDRALIRAAADPDESVRMEAVRGLGVIGPKVAEDPPPELRRALDDPSGTVRMASVEALSRFPVGLPRLLPEVVRSFERARPEARPAYLALLGRIRPRAFRPERAVPALASALASPADDVRDEAARALAGFGAAALPALPALAASLARPARGTGSTDATGAGAAADPALAAARAMARITPEFPFIGTAPPPVDRETARALAGALRSGPAPVREAVALALGRLRPSPEVVDGLGQAALDPVEAVRAAALHALHDVGATMPFVPPAPVGLGLEDPSPTVRYWAAAALGHAGLGVDPFLPALLRHAEHDPDAEVRGVCAAEIQEFIRPPAVTPAVVPILAESLDSPQAPVRRAACGLLGHLGPASAPAVPRLIRLLADGVEKRGGLDAPAAGDQVNAAATAIGQVAPRTTQAAPAARALAEALAAEGRPQVIEALARFGPLARPALPRLRELERDHNGQVARAAARALATIRDAK